MVQSCKVNGLNEMTKSNKLNLSCSVILRCIIKCFLLATVTVTVTHTHNTEREIERECVCT